ncbi:MAG: DUF4854 domain-containing protein [Peptococcaceae bacterium]|nr:DUF4854 domain-containing protein [Peptococcaceae bacterium]
MKQTKFFLLCALILLVALSLIGCKQTDEILVKVYVESAQATAASEMKDSGVEDVFEWEILARGSSVVYSYKYKNEDQNTLSKDELDNLLESQSSVYKGVITELKKGGVQHPSIIVEFSDTQGNIIISKEFKE